MLLEKENLAKKKKKKKDDTFFFLPMWQIAFKNSTVISQFSVKIVD